MSEVIIDVRERDEFDQEHVENAINVPLSGFASQAPGVLNQVKDRDVVFMCRSGLRAQQALEQAKGLGYNDAHNFRVYEGGLQQWKQDGQSVVASGKGGLPLIRQVQLIVGTAVTVLAILGYFLNPAYALGAAVMGMGLLMAGATGNCALAATLAKAPWNKAHPNLQKELCQASSGSQGCSS